MNKDNFAFFGYTIKKKYSEIPFADFAFVGENINGEITGIGFSRRLLPVPGQDKKEVMFKDFYIYKNTEVPIQFFSNEFVDTEELDRTFAKLIGNKVFYDLQETMAKYVVWDEEKGYYMPHPETWGRYNENRYYSAGKTFRPPNFGVDRWVSPPGIDRDRLKKYGGFEDFKRSHFNSEGKIIKSLVSEEAGQNNLLTSKIA